MSPLRTRKALLFISAPYIRFITGYAFIASIKWSLFWAFIAQIRCYIQMIISWTMNTRFGGWTKSCSLWTSQALLERIIPKMRRSATNTLGSCIKGSLFITFNTFIEVRVEMRILGAINTRFYIRVIVGS